MSDLPQLRRLEAHCPLEAPVQTPVQSPVESACSGRGLLWLRLGLHPLSAGLHLLAALPALEELELVAASR